MPSAVKANRGNPGKRKLNKDEPDALPGDPVIPEKLSDEAKAKCREVIEQLRGMGILGQADGLAIAAIGYQYDVWMAAVADVREFGVMIKVPVMGRKGTPDEETPVGWITRKNPAVAAANEALKTLKSYMIEFGLTPASRGKLHVEKPKESEPGEDYFSKKPFVVA